MFTIIIDLSYTAAQKNKQTNKPKKKTNKQKKTNQKQNKKQPATTTISEHNPHFKQDSQSTKWHQVKSTTNKARVQMHTIWDPGVYPRWQIFHRVKHNATIQYQLPDKILFIMLNLLTFGVWCLPFSVTCCM